MNGGGWQTGYAHGRRRRRKGLAVVAEPEPVANMPAGRFPFNRMKLRNEYPSAEKNFAGNRPCKTWALRIAGVSLSCASSSLTHAKFS